MERARRVIKWSERSETVKTVAVLVIVVVATMGGYGLFMLGMRTSSPLVVVTSESMIPALYPGDLLVLQGRAVEDISVGDIIVYVDDWYTDAPIVHRVVEIQVVTGTYYFFTRGDANHANDIGNRTIDEIVGVVVYRIPNLGHVSLFLRSPPGYLFIALVFIAIIILPELACKGRGEDEVEQQKAGMPPVEG
ncbi:MAG: signal peptidase I [Candidatus Thorarchaeota archaeon]|nr:MAG: signal peptidase I [Candidatus Thorarchaeota archaeon]